MSIANNGVTNKYLWCGTEICEQRDSAGSSVTKQFFPQGVRDSSTNYFYTRDHLGSIREVTDTSQNIVARYDYDPYGRRAKISGSYDADFGYTGHFHEQPSWMTTGLNLALFRVYDPELGRWLSRDPIGEQGGLNLYGYVSGDPINWYDPLGLYAVMYCWRCKDDPTGPMHCFISIDGGAGDVFDTNLGPNDPSVTPGDPYGKNGPLPPGTYNVVPKPSGPAKDTRTEGGQINYHKGTPSITGPGMPAGSITTPAGTSRSSLRIHGRGHSQGCITCQDPGQIEHTMNQQQNSGGMQVNIREVECTNCYE